MHPARGSLVAVALLALLGMAWTLDAPVLMWSGSNIFSGKNVQIQNTVPASQFKAILARLASKEASNLSPALASAFANTETIPEVVVLYLEPMIRTDQVSQNRDSLIRLRKEVTSSKSSVVVPFMAYEVGVNVVVPAISSMVAALPEGAKILYQGSQRTSFFKQLQREVASLEVLDKEALKADHAIFSNGRLDVVIVELTAFETTLANKLSKDDETMANVQEIVEDATNGNYVALFATESVLLPAIQTEFETATTHIRLQANNIERDIAVDAEDATESNIPGWAAYFPSWFWEGLIASIIFLIIALVAICCLKSVQTPTTFLAEKKKGD